MKENKLPYYGIGPYYCGSIIIITIISILLTHFNIIPEYHIQGLELFFKIIGIAIIIVGISLWVWGALKSDIHENIDNDILITRGAYAHVRNPIYSAFLFVATGLIVFYNNVLLFVLPVIYWAILTELMKRTEEQWLEEKFGDEYREYCKKVNRCIPWF